MSGIQKLAMAKPTDCTRGGVRGNHPLTENRLMEPDPSKTTGVRPSRLIDDHRAEVRPQDLRILKSNGERQCTRIVGVNEDRPRRQVEPLGDTVEVDQRSRFDEGPSETGVVAMVWISSPIPVPQHSVVTDFVFVRSRLSWLLGRRRDGDRQFHSRWSENALGPEEVDESVAHNHALS